MLKCSNKTIKKIQQILVFVKIQFFSKRATKIMAYLAIMLNTKGSSKRKATSNNRYYHCYKFGHFGRNCKNTNTDQQLLVKHIKSRFNKPANKPNQ